MTTLRKLLLILPVAAFTISPALAQSEAPKTEKPATTQHHHKRTHHTKAHKSATPAPAKSAG